MSKFSKWLDEVVGEENVNKAVDIFSPVLGGILGWGSSDQSTPAPTFTPPDTSQSQNGINAITGQLYSQLLGLMDSQANTDLANEQIGSLNDILEQKASLAGKDKAAGRFVAGNATATDISDIIRGKNSALAQGVTQINTAAQNRADANQARGLDLLTQMRGQLVGEQQMAFDNALNVYQLDYQRWYDAEGFRLSQEEQDAKFWGGITQVIGTVVGFAVAGPPGAVVGSQVGGAT